MTVQDLVRKRELSLPGPRKLGGGGSRLTYFGNYLQMWETLELLTPGVFAEISSDFFFFFLSPFPNVPQPVFVLSLLG